MLYDETTFVTRRCDPALRAYCAPGAFFIYADDALEEWRDDTLLVAGGQTVGQANRAALHALLDEWLDSDGGAVIHAPSTGDPTHG